MFLFAGHAAAGPYGWTLSGSNTDPFQSTGSSGVTSTDVYLWLACDVASEGVQSAEFGILCSRTVSDFTPAAGFTNSATLNGDKFSSISYFITLSQQHGMAWIGTGMHPSNAKAHTRDDLNNLGGYSGLITASPSDASPDEMIPGDITFAKAFGERLVEALATFGKK